MLALKQLCLNIFRPIVLSETDQTSPNRRIDQMSINLTLMTFFKAGEQNVYERIDDLTI